MCRKLCRCLCRCLCRESAAIPLGIGKALCRWLCRWLCRKACCQLCRKERGKPFAGARHRARKAVWRQLAAARKTVWGAENGRGKPFGGSWQQRGKRAAFGAKRRLGARWLAVAASSGGWAHCGSSARPFLRFGAAFRFSSFGCSAPVVRSSGALRLVRARAAPPFGRSVVVVRGAVLRYSGRAPRRRLALRAPLFLLPLSLSPTCVLLSPRAPRPTERPERSNRTDRRGKRPRSEGAARTASHRQPAPSCIAFPFVKICEKKNKSSRSLALFRSNLRKLFVALSRT